MTPTSDLPGARPVPVSRAGANNTNATRVRRDVVMPRPTPSAASI